MKRDTPLKPPSLFPDYCPELPQVHRARLLPKAFLIVVVVLTFLLVTPAQAGTLYQEGSPRLTASLSGTNEFNPGDTVNISVSVRNTGTNGIKIVQPGLATRDDLPNTAKFLTINLENGGNPVSVKSGPQVIGDLPGGSVGTAVFSVRIDPSAPSGDYVLPVTYRYLYIMSADTFDNGTIQYRYGTTEGTLPVGLTVRPVVLIEVLFATPSNLNAGSEGYIDMKIRNAGSGYGRKAVIKVVRSGASAIIPNDSSVYIGDFPPGGIAACRYRVSVLPDAQDNVYPADVMVMYSNDEGDFVFSRNETIGVRVGNKTEFTVVSDPVVLNPGNQRIISVVYRNSGPVTVYSAKARVVAVIPFTTSEDIAELGDLGPGETRVASFGLTVDRTATLKAYGLDSEIRYRDALNNSYVSATIPVKVIVTGPEGFTSFVSNPVYLSIVTILIIVGLYISLKRGKTILEKFMRKS